VLETKGLIMVELVGIEPTASLETAEVIDSSWTEQLPQMPEMPEMPEMPRNPEAPNSLYVYCTVILSKINLLVGSAGLPKYGERRQPLA